MRRKGLNKIVRSRHFRGLTYGAALLLLVTALGTVVYHEIGSPIATWIDSFYFTFITIATHWRPVNAARFRQEANNHAG